MHEQKGSVTKAQAADLAFDRGRAGREVTHVAEGGLQRGERRGHFRRRAFGGLCRDIDFAGVADGPRPGESPPEAVLDSSGGAAGPPFVQYVAPTRVWRVFFDVDAGQGMTADLRLFLRRGDAALTETWTYAWTR